MNTFEISCDPSRLDLDLIHGYISGQSYWAAGMPRPLLEKALAHSLCFGAYLDGRQVGFARVTTDRATFAYLADVFVLPEHRGQGYSKRLIAAVMAHPDLQDLRRFMLATSDAHGLYAQFGFKAPARPEILMERTEPDVYKRLERASQGGQG
ncbi:GNAT family N-acetyltransferase [Oxalobacteraceae bacterium A2-2]